VPTELELLAEGDGDDAVAKVLVDAALAQRVKAEFGAGAVLRERSDGSIEFAIPCANLNAFRVWLFAMVDRAEVLGPPRVREHIVSHLKKFAVGN
jgi:hypothetical protein